MTPAFCLRDLSMTSPTPETEFALVCYRHRAMATVFEVLLPWGTPRGEAIASDAAALIDRLEAQLTGYRDTSEVCRLNYIAAAAPVPVERGLFKLLSDAQRLSTSTGGAFDITAGPLIKAWGFFHRQGRIPSQEEIANAMKSVGMAHVSLDPDRRSVRFDRRGVEINLGSIGKGYALDRVARRMQKRWKQPSALLNGGTSSVLAVGNPPNDPRGWLVGLKHPDQSNRRLAILRLRDRAMASSGTTFQHFDYNDRRFGHLLDPRTGRPAHGIALATALAPTAAAADALATAFFVLGIEGTARYCAENPNVAAAMLTDDPHNELVTFNLAPDDVLPGGEVQIPAADDSSWESA
ncbi:MAG: FAD:protein FMN transferase [Gemmataceae bacterium]